MRSWASCSLPVSGSERDSRRKKCFSKTQSESMFESEAQTRPSTYLQSPDTFTLSVQITINPC